MLHRKYFAIVIVLINACIPLFALASEPLQVVVSIPPQAYFVEQIGGEFVDVVSMLPEGGFPHTYEPTPQQMRLLSQADMYVRIHVEFEDAWWAKMRAINSDMHVVDSTGDATFIYTESDDQHREEEMEDRHDHHGRDPHIWLSPVMVNVQAEHVYQGLITLDPAHKAQYTEGKIAFLDALDTLDHEIRDQLSNISSREFLIFHPSWAYFAREYNLEQIPIELEGKEPSAAEMVRLMKTARQKNLRVIFVQPQTNRRSADTLARQLGATVELLDPLAKDWMNNMRIVAGKLAEALK